MNKRVSTLGAMTRMLKGRSDCVTVLLWVWVYGVPCPGFVVTSVTSVFNYLCRCGQQLEASEEKAEGGKH